MLASGSSRKGLSCIPGESNLGVAVPVSDVQPPALVVSAVGGAADLSVALHARQPGLDVQLAVGWCTQVTRGHVLHHNRTRKAGLFWKCSVTPCKVRVLEE